MVGQLIFRRPFLAKPLRSLLIVVGFAPFPNTFPQSIAGPCLKVMEYQAAGEGQGRSEMEFTDIETISESFESACIFHVVVDIIGFVLFMHHQIPSLLQDMSLEFDELQQESKDLNEMVFVQEEMKASFRRKHIARKREVKQGIRRMEKLMTSVNQVKAALQSLIAEVPDIENVALVLGPSPLRPLHVYELWFSAGKVVSVDFNRSRVTEALSKKAVRMLISKGAGSDRNTYAGPSKLFLLVKAPSSLNVPSEFLPKHDFRCPKKIVPFKLRFKCRKLVGINTQCDDTQCMEMNAQCDDPQTNERVLLGSPSNNFIWFQCRHVIKGLGSKGPSNEEE